MNQVETEIAGLGRHGDGIAEGPLYVPGALPGEWVSGVRDGNRLSEVKIVRRSPDRVTPICEHYGICGGCRLMHASDALVASWKTTMVKSALAAQGIDAKVLEPVTSPPSSRRRATLAARRTKKGVIVGFHTRASEAVTGIEMCRLLDPQLMASLDVVRALCRVGASRRAELSVTLTASEGGVDVLVVDGKPLSQGLRADLASIAQEHDVARLSWGEETIVIRRPPWQRFGRAMVLPPPGAFLQATKEGERALVERVEMVVSGSARIVDLFSGCGTFSLPLAENAEVHAVEAAASMTSALDQGWRRTQGLKQVTTETRDLFRRPLRPDNLAHYDAAVIDPPRAGAETQVAHIVAAQVPKVAMVSCNPATFARDVAQLAAGGYDVGPVHVVDQFRWSSHVEIVAACTLS